MERTGVMFNQAGLSMEDMEFSGQAQTGLLQETMEEN